METTRSPYDDLGTKAYNALRDMIARGELAPGQKLIQEDIAELLGVSRTPLLQAISKLTKDHYIETIPRRGSYVKRFSSQDVLDAFDVRSCLEPMGAWNAALRIQASDVVELGKLLQAYVDEASTSLDPIRLYTLDHAFHLGIMQCSGNKFLPDLLGNFDNILCNSERLLKTPAQTISEHTSILSALEEHDSDKARDAMSNHVHGGARPQLAALLHDNTMVKETRCNAQD